MNLKLDPESAVLGAVLVLSGALAADELPGLIQYVFKAGDPIRSAEVNANFASLNTAVNVLQGGISKPITGDRLADGSVTAAKLQSRDAPANGQVLGYQDGQLTWGTAGQGPKGDPGPQGPAGPRGPAGREATSPTIQIYRKITERAFPVVGRQTYTKYALCDAVFDPVTGVGVHDKAIGGILQHTGGESILYLQMNSSYPNTNNSWASAFRNTYDNPNSILYVDIGVVCVRQ